MLDNCPVCDICEKPRFDVSMNYVMSNHVTIATTSVYKLCEGPKTCLFHCTCHLDIPVKLGVTQVLHVI